MGSLLVSFHSSYLFFCILEYLISCGYSIVPGFSIFISALKMQCSLSDTMRVIWNFLLTIKLDLFDTLMDICSLTYYFIYISAKPYSMNKFGHCKLHWLSVVNLLPLLVGYPVFFQ